MRYLPLVLLIAGLLLSACGAAPQAPAPAAPTAAAPTGQAAEPSPTRAVVTAAPAATAAAPAASPAPAQPAPSPAALTAVVVPTGTLRPSAPEAPTTQGETMPTPPALGNSGSPNPAPAAVMDAILADAAQRSGLDRAAITVQSAEAVEWPDSSLGCPQPGMNYMQVITPGYRVVLRAGDSDYDYHTNERGRFVLCK